MVKIRHLNEGVITRDCSYNGETVSYEVPAEAKETVDDLKITERVCVFCEVRILTLELCVNC